jgi:hypothetical protein
MPVQSPPPAPEGADTNPYSTFPTKDIPDVKAGWRKGFHAPAPSRRVLVLEILGAIVVVAVVIWFGVAVALWHT